MERSCLAMQVFATVAIIVIALLQSAFASPLVPWPYLQVYPPVNESDARTPLYFALMLSFGGVYTSIGALPGVQVALDYVNNHPDILPEYTLHYTLTDSQCDRVTALDSFFRQMLRGRTKIGWVGSGCSLATEPTAELTQFYNITQLSCISSSPILADRKRFRSYYQLLGNEAGMARGFFGIVKQFGWKKIAILTQNNPLFTLTMGNLKEMLEESGIEYSEKIFRNEQSIASLGAEPFDPDSRIFLLSMYSYHARAFICEAYKQGLHYPKYQFLIIGWYLNNWWVEPDTTRDLGCKEEEILSVLARTLAPLQFEFPTNASQVTEGGLTLTAFEEQYWRHTRSSINAELPVDLPSLVQENVFQYAYHCHEATLALALGLNKTNKYYLNSDTQGQTVSLENFTYSDSLIAEEIFENIGETNFIGISGNKVHFLEDGTREINLIPVLQYFPNQQGIEILEVGSIISSEEDGLIYILNDQFTEKDTWPEGIPNDGIPLKDTVTVALPLTVMFVLLATAGLAFTIVCLAFNFIFRNKELIQKSRSKLNYITGIGAIILYMNVIIYVIPTTDSQTVAVLCNLTPWLISLGYSLCYGVILVKMGSVWYKCNNPIPALKITFQDWHLAMVVLFLVVIDVIILGSYTLAEGVRGELHVKLIRNRGNPEEIKGLTAVVHQYFFYVCESENRVALFGVLYGYKGLLQIIALILAYYTRKVKVKGLNDSRYIAAATYVTSIVLAIIIVSTYTLADYVNAFPAVVGVSLLVGTTMILVLVFVPKMVELYRDPEGKNVFSSTMQVTSDEISNSNRGIQKEEMLSSMQKKLEFSLQQPQQKNGSKDQVESIAYSPTRTEEQFVSDNN